MSITIINLSHPTEQLKTITENWNDLPEQLQNEILGADHYTLKPQSLLIYKDRQCILDCMVSIDLFKSGKVNWNRIVIQNCYDKTGLKYDYSNWFKTWKGWQGWEHEIIEYTREKMKENKKAYLENSPYPLKVVKGREKITNE